MKGFVCILTDDVTKQKKSYGSHKPYIIITIVRSVHTAVVMLELILGVCHNDEELVAVVVLVAW